MGPHAWKERPFGFSEMVFQHERENRPHLCCVYPATPRDERERVVVLLDADSSSASLSLWAFPEAAHQENVAGWGVFL